jgi:hypothetical protein
MECDPSQVSHLATLTRHAHPDAQINVHRDLAGRERVVEARLPPMSNSARTLD